MEQMVNFSTSDGFILHGMLSKENDEKNSVVIHVNGRGASQFGKFCSFMRNFYQQNHIHFFSFDLRIWDYSKEKMTCPGLPFEKLQEDLTDLEAAIQFVTNELGYEKVILEGHSLGASIALKYLMKKGNPKVSQAILLSLPDLLGTMNRLNPLEVQKRELLAFKEVKEGRPNTLVWNDGVNVYSAKNYLDMTSLLGNPSDSYSISFEKNHSNPNLEQISTPIDIFCGELDPQVSISKEKEYFENHLQNGSFTIIPGANHTFEKNKQELEEKIIEKLCQRQNLKIEHQSLNLKRKSSNGSIETFLILISTIGMGIFIAIFLKK